MCNICNKWSLPDTDNKIVKAINNILKKTGIKIPYPIQIKNWDDGDALGMFCQFCKSISIHKVLLDYEELLERVIYHEFLHLFLQVDNKFFYDILIDKFTTTYFEYLNRYCSNYQIISFYPKTDILISFKQNTDDETKNKELMFNNKSISPNYHQFSMLSEFIVHNSDYYYGCHFNDDIFNDKILLDMNKFVLKIIKENI